MKFFFNFWNEYFKTDLDSVQSTLDFPDKFEELGRAIDDYKLINKAKDLLHVLDAGLLRSGTGDNELEIWLPFSQVDNYEDLARNMFAEFQKELPRVDDAKVKEITPEWELEVFVLPVDMETVKFLADLYDG